VWEEFPYDDFELARPKRGQPAQISNLARVKNIYGKVADYNHERLPVFGIAKLIWSVAKMVAFCFHREQAIKCLRDAHPNLSLREAFKQPNIHACHQPGFHEKDNTAAAVRLGTQKQNNEATRKAFWLWPIGKPEECEQFVGVQATAKARGWNDGHLSQVLNGRGKSCHGFCGSYTKPLN
jgi:hypothetical protein